ncbi:phloretin 4'-O-glucosyltransferase-like [Apium graveolens]|uniref:phloretin 4'-O-glucosyltransferase-like n=1 Tax=Apium graveolens TaxID=4045 RepID=UPI003D7BC26B
MESKHFLLISLAAQSHINPTLQLAKILVRHGAKVTFATTSSGLSRLNNLPTLPGLSYASFSDNKSQDPTKKVDADNYFITLRRVGPQNVTELLHQLSDDGSPVTFIVYTVLLPWVAEVAREMDIPSAFLFIQCAIAFTIFHRFFNSHDGLHADNDDFGLDASIKLPKLSLFTSHDIPSFLVPGNDMHASLAPLFREHIQTLEKDPNPCVLINTFDALENDFIHSFPSSIKFFPIGPLLPSAISDKHDSNDKSFGGHMFQSPKQDYLSWLDSKPDRSVIYVSFGSLVVLKETQKEEILQGLKETGRPFLWVIREIKDEELSCVREKSCISEEMAMIVPWCSQVEVLSHRATGCFVTHCGWNSTLESITSGVPMVGCPSFSEQKTNVKIIDELWRNGVRVKENEQGAFVREEIRRCVDIVMGEEEQGNEIKGNANKWKSLAIEALKEGGSSHNNLLDFLQM